MKLLPIALLQIVTAAGAVVVYDYMRDDAPPTSGPSLTARAAEVPDVDRRLAALESRGGPTLTSSSPDTALLLRIEALERALEEGALASVRAPRTADKQSEESPRREEDTFEIESAAEPSAAALRRFRQLRDAARREDEAQKHRARVDRLLGKAGITLSSRQRERVHAAYLAFQPRVGEIWGVAKQEAQATIAAGGHVERREVVANTMALIQQEFAATLDGTVSGGEAEAIAQAVMSNSK